MDLTQYRVPSSDEAYYFPDFITTEEESFLLRKINETPLPNWKQLANRRLRIIGGSMTTKGVLVPEDIPAFVHKYPDIIKRIEATGVFQSSPHGAPNHFILNEYFPGQGIMPHEDGPAYYPVVATLSLGSHAMFHYYQYKPQAVSANGDNNTNSSENGRPIDPTPVLSVLLEPRSLIVTQSSLYTSHLHGIDDVVEDVFLQASNSENCSVRIANLDLLKGTEEREAIINGGVLKRGIRYSLTCRDVAKVASSIPLRKRY